MIRSIALALVTLTASAAMAQPAQPQTAEEHYEAGKRFYAVNEFDKAIAEFKAAYTLQADPNILFNIAQAMRKKGDCVGAIEFYNKFLKESPNAPNRSKVEGWIAELDACAKAQPKEVVTPTKPVDVQPPPVKSHPPPKPAPPVAPPEPHRSKLPLVGIVTAGVGVALVATGTGLGISSNRIEKGVEDRCKTACNWVDERNEIDRGHDRASQAKILFGVGSAAIAGGAVLFILGRRANSESPVAVVPTTSGGLLVTSGRF